MQWRTSIIWEGSRGLISTGQGNGWMFQRGTYERPPLSLGHIHILLHRRSYSGGGGAVIWFTSDHHFGHENIIKYCKRPFKDANEMDAALIERWNSVVKPEDTVYHLGDFSLSKTVWPLWMQLTGNMVIIPGGHDFRWLENEPADHLESKTGAIMIEQPLHTLEMPNPGSEYPLVIVLCHYPMLSWDRSHYGSLHLYGHVHGTIPNIQYSSDVQLPPGQRRGKRMEVGVDCHNFYPISLEQVLETLDHPVQPLDS